MSSNHSLLTTERLLLRPPAPADAETIFNRYASDVAVTRYLGWPRHESLADTQAFIQFSIEKWEQDQVGPFLIIDKLEEQIIGGTGLEISEPKVASTGYVLSRCCWGRGFATEALHAMVQLAQKLPIEYVFALTHPEHRASIRVLEKCGFNLEEKLTDYIEFPNLQQGEKIDALKFGLDIKPEDSSAKDTMRE